MQVIKLTDKQSRERDRRKKIEKIKQKLTIIKAILTGKGLSPDDTRTIQVHADGQGNYRDYYIENTYLQEDTSSFTCVRPLIEDFENNRFVYLGMTPSADNACPVLEFNVPIAELVESPYGNMILQQVLTEENMIAKRDSYYKTIGEESKPLPGHTLLFGKPDFPAGKILKGKDGKFSYVEDVSQDILEELKNERDKARKEDLMRDPDSVHFNSGPLITALQDCFLDQSGRTGKINYTGTNEEAFPYKYFTYDDPLKADDYYVYIGQVEMGKSAVDKTSESGVMKLVSPYRFDNVVLWSKGKPLPEYFQRYKQNGLNFALGKIVTEHNISDKIEDAKKQEKDYCFAGGILIDSDGRCQIMDEVPLPVKSTVESYYREKSKKILSFAQPDNNAKDKAVGFPGMQRSATILEGDFSKRRKEDPSNETREDL